MDPLASLVDWIALYGALGLFAVAAGGGAASPHARRFATGTLLGVALWNGAFLIAGYAAAQAVADLNASAVAIKFVLAILGLEALSVLLWRRFGRVHGRRAQDPAG